jgi:hypothetical protein
MRRRHQVATARRLRPHGGAPWAESSLADLKLAQCYERDDSADGLRLFTRVGLGYSERSAPMSDRKPGCS